MRDGCRFDTEHQGLTLREIYANLQLPVCRLVILSACETGLLSSQLTDEYIGLASGFSQWFLYFYMRVVRRWRVV